MKVFNLTEKALVYRRRTIPPNGGSFDFLDLRVIPLRDQKLAQGTKAVLAFGTLPEWWLLKQQQKKAAQLAARKAAIAKKDAPAAKEVALEESAPKKDKK
jgi:myo-inositol catabolism protein IolC